MEAYSPATGGVSIIRVAITTTIGVVLIAKEAIITKEATIATEVVLAAKGATTIEGVSIIKGASSTVQVLITTEGGGREGINNGTTGEDTTTTATTTATATTAEVGTTTGEVTEVDTIDN